MEYFINDVVEITTARYKSWNDYPDHEKGYFINQSEPAPFIGQRFTIKSIDKEFIYAQINGRFCLRTHTDCVTLYKRPLFNKIISVLCKL